jgi:hypothetical protein
MNESINPRRVVVKDGLQSIQRILSSLLLLFPWMDENSNPGPSHCLGPWTDGWNNRSTVCEPKKYPPHTGGGRSIEAMMTRQAAVGLISVWVNSKE